MRIPNTPNPNTPSRSPARLGGLAAVGILLLGAAVGAHAQTPAFSDQTEAAGVSFIYDHPVETPGYPMHGGASPCDFNNDGWVDLFVVGGGGNSDRLFINDGDGTFTNRANYAGLTESYRGNAANAIDYDGDGWCDIFVSSFGDMANEPMNGQHKLYRNNGDFTFTDVAVSAGVNSTGDYADGYGVSWGDYDLDGDLDLWVGGWHEDPLNPGVSANNRLFRNDGDGTFTDVTAELNLFEVKTQGFGAIFADMNQDRYPELMVAGDFGTSRYYSNNRDGTFTPEPILSPGDTKVHNGMGTTIGDFNRDGLMDWFVTAIYPAWADEGPPGNRLYMNLGGHEFQSLPESAGVNDGGWGWGTSVIDFNHDGWQDIVMTNGWHNCPDPVTGECFVAESAYLFENNQDETFTEVAQTYGIDHTLQGRGLVTLDYDMDGDMDIVMTSNPTQGPGDDPETGELRLYRNDLSGSGINWLQVELDSSGNPALAPHGWGANVVVRRNTAEQHYRITAGSNYLSRSELIAHFGVGGTEMLDEVRVEWTDGFQTVLTDVATNQRLTVAAPLPLTHGPLVRTEPVDFTVVGLRPGEVARFAASAVGTGEGPCFDALGGLCIDLVSAKILGEATADAGGTAVLSITVPPNLPDTVWVQAVTMRGEGGITSLKTNVSMASVVDP